ncbi:MAG: Ig-like domain-containing protein, partial [Bacteroidaceae bacterium]|nr:Ig-like domain-containing protein [Bacteroidaceae bacterium]
TVAATAVTPAKTEVTVVEGADVVVPVTLTPFQATTAVTATSSAEGKATVSVTGHNVTIHGVSDGSATITVSAGAGVTATIAVTVTDASA